MLLRIETEIGEARGVRVGVNPEHAALFAEPVRVEYVVVRVKLMAAGWCLLQFVCASFRVLVYCFRLLRIAPAFNFDFR